MNRLQLSKSKFNLKSYNDYVNEDMNEWIAAVKRINPNTVSVHKTSNQTRNTLYRAAGSKTAGLVPRHKPTFSNTSTTFQIYIYPLNCTAVHKQKPKYYHIQTLLHIQLTIHPTSRTLSHTSLPTSFPRQDLKTSIAVEFIKVVRWIVCVRAVWSVVSVLLSGSDLIVSLSASIRVFSCLPACLYPRLCQQFHQDKNSD